MPNGRSSASSRPSTKRSRCFFEEGAAEELVGGQGPVDRGVEDRDLFAGGAQLDGGGAAVGADDPPVDDVRAAFLGHPGEAEQGLGAEPVVGVEEEDVVAGGAVQSGVAGLARAARGLLVQHGQIGVAAGLFGQPFRAAVGGSVVDRDHLDAALVQCLGEDGAEAAVEVAPGVVHRHDHGDRRRHGVRAGGSRGHEVVRGGQRALRSLLNPPNCPASQPSKRDY